MNLFFELIQISLENRSRFSHLPCESEWQSLYMEARRHSMVGPLFVGVERFLKNNETNNVPNWAYQWMSDVVIIENQNAVQIKKIQDFITRLGHIKYSILKGQSVATLYDNPLRRQCGDLDIWIDGKRKEILKFAEEFGKPEKVFYHHVGLGQVNGLDVEVHFTPSWMNNVFVNNRLQKWYRSMFPVVCNNEFNLAFNRVYLLNHIYRHLFNEGIGLRQLMDYYYVLKQGSTEQEKSESMSLIKSFNMGRFAGAVMYIMKEVFGLEDKYLLTNVDERLGKKLLQEIMTAGNFGQYDIRNKRNVDEGFVRRAFRRIKHDFRFVTQYPNEVFWSPIWKTYHLIFRLKYNRYA